MPRLPTLRTRVLQELARQVRFQSEDAARRQLGRAEQLALQLLGEQAADAPAAYPEEWVVFRITGLRTETGGDVMVREALLSDLPALIDRLSAAAKLTLEDLDDEEKVKSKAGNTGGRAASATRATGSNAWLSVEDVCARWKVSRKTLERYRRLGLVSRRVMLGRGRERVVYGERQVRAFERVHGKRVEDAGAFARRDVDSRERVLRRAARYRERLGWSLFKCAQRIAARDARSVEGVRKLLAAHDARAERPIFGAPGVLDSEQKGLVERTSKRGGNMSAVAGRVRKSRATVYRVVGERRVDRLRELDLRVPAGGAAVFERADAADVLLGHAAASDGIGRRGAINVGELLRMAAEMDPEPAAHEQARATACWYLVWRAERGVGALARHGARVRASAKRDAGGDAGRDEGVDAIETWLLWASRLRAEMVRSQVPLLVRAIENQTGRSVGAIPGSALRELCEIGLDAVIDSADRFDPFKGGRLAAPVGVAVGRAISQWLKHGREELGAPGRAMARVDMEQLALPDWARRVHPWQEWLEAPLGVREKLGAIAERERRVLEMRYGWEGPPRTVEDVAKELRTKATRVAAMQRRAVAMLAYGAPAKMPRVRRKGAA